MNSATWSSDTKTPREPRWRPFYNSKILILAYCASMFAIVDVSYAPMPPANAHVYSNNVRGKRSLGWPAPADCPARLIACSLQATRGDYAQIWGSSGFCLLGHERKGPIVLSPIPTREWRCRQKVRHSMASLNHFLGILLAVNTFEQAQLLQLTSALSTIQGFQIVFAPQW